ncbi:MAG: Crp/Fnr family transcriptional regulator [Bacteroidetes bacterium]|nr:MAG: Crp/Fnr family transcriptional regulator [Bacteroidota bacterium]
MLKDVHRIFPSFESELLENLEKAAEFKIFEPGEEIVKTGQYFKSILLVLEGMIKVYREDDEGNEYFMYYLEPGQACSLAMIPTGRREKSEVMGKVVNNTTVIAVPPECMDQWMFKYKTWYEYVLDSHRSGFEKLLATFDHTAFKTMDSKLIHYLRLQQEMHKSNNFQVNKAEIARELNSSREVISRLMKKFTEKGMIKVMKKQFIEIINLDF